MSKLFGLTAVVGACLVLLAQPTKAADDPKPIKEIMKEAHGSAKKGDPTLRDKATGKDATDADKKALLALYKDLAKHEPAKGDKAEWKKKTTELVAVTTELVDGKEGAAAKVKKASDCKACHDFYKNPK